MRKIALFLRCAPFFGGTFQYAESMLNALLGLPNDQYKILVIYTRDEWKPILDSKKVEAIQIRFNESDRWLADQFWCAQTPLRERMLRKSMTNFHVLGKLLKRQKVNICIFPGQEISSSAFCHVKTIGTIHDLMHRYESRFPEVSANGEFQNRELVYTKVCRYATRILVDSQIGKQQVIESYSADTKKIEILPFIALENKSYMETELVLPAIPDKFIFYPAQFWKHKNHENLIKAIHSLKRGDIHLVLVGSKQNNDAYIERLIAELGLEKNVHMLGYISEEQKIMLYKKARAMVMPTYFGPTNIPPLEAFLYGCPVAVSNIYGMPEQVGDAAILFDPSNVEEIADTVQRLWDNDDLCEDLIRKGHHMYDNWNQRHFNQQLRKIIMSMELLIL